MTWLTNLENRDKFDRTLFGKGGLFGDKPRVYIGPPKATRYFTVNELANEGVVGVYQFLEADAVSSHFHLMTFISSAPIKTPQKGRLQPQLS